MLCYGVVSLYPTETAHVLAGSFRLCIQTSEALKCSVLAQLKEKCAESVESEIAS